MVGHERDHFCGEKSVNFQVICIYGTEKTLERVVTLMIMLREENMDFRVLPNLESGAGPSALGANVVDRLAMVKALKVSVRRLVRW